MYILFCCESSKSFVLRGVVSSSSFRLPSDGQSWVKIGDSIAGFLDAMSLVKDAARRRTWPNWEVRVEHTS